MRTNLPPHLAIFAHPKSVMVSHTIETIITGYEPEEQPATPCASLPAQKLRGESWDEYVTRKVGYQIDNGRVRVFETVGGWNADITTTDGLRKLSGYYKKSQLLNAVFEILEGKKNRRRP